MVRNQKMNAQSLITGIRSGPDGRQSEIGSGKYLKSRQRICHVQLGWLRELVKKKDSRSSIQNPDFHILLFPNRV